MNTSIRSRISTFAIMAFAAIFAAFPAFATTTTPGEDAVNTAVSNGAGQATNLIITNIPIILAVAVLWVALSFGKKLLGKLS